MIDVTRIFFIEAVGDDTLFRLHGAGRIRDARKMGVVARILEPFGFVRVHRNHAVNIARIKEIRRRRDGDDWEVKLRAPVNRVLPVSRNLLRGLWRAFGE